MTDKTADFFRSPLVPDDQILTIGELSGAGDCRLRFFMLVVSMDDGGVMILSVALDPLPHVNHGTAGRVYKDTSFFLQNFHLTGRCAKGGDDDNVVGSHCFNRLISFSLTIQEADAHLAETVIDPRVVNEFSGEINRAIRKLAP